MFACGRCSIGFVIFFLVLFSLSCLPRARSAQISDLIPVSPETVVETLADPALIDRTHDRLADGVLSLSQKIDAVIGRGEPIPTSEKSQVNLIFLTRAQTSGEFSFKTKINANLVLPRTQRRFNLILHNLSERFRDESIITEKSQTHNAYREPNAALSEPAYSTALRYMLVAEKKLRANTDAGVRLVAPLDPYWQVKAGQDLTLGSTALAFSQEIHWYNSSGHGASLGLRVDRSLNANFLLRQSNLATWTAVDSTAELEHGISLYQTLAKERTLTYFMSVTSKSLPHFHATAYESGLSLRSRLHWPWLTGEMTLLQSFTEENQFSGQSSVTLQLQTQI